ncbi:MAG: oxidoreductase [Desulforudis sp.]|jgi:F420-non-reducing hydrogenase small subunit|nr:oxidoreductase [Clostridia bacterium]RJX21945.1 MAG: oxidoreductase [Desulforudis sp.]
MSKLKLASYWGAACGGCDVAILDIHEKIVDLSNAADIVFWPIAVDFKYSDLEAYEDGYIDVCLFHGAVRNSENEHIAKLLRQKSKVMVAFGSCAISGGIPGLANFKKKDDIFARAYFDSPSTQNKEKVLPVPVLQMPEGEIDIPEFYKDVKCLADVVDVEYYMPGCPPTSEQIWNVVLAIVTGQLPPAGSFVGCEDRALCNTCKRTKTDKKIKKFVRPHEIIVDPDLCLLEQGLVCMGPVTRAGCGNQCTGANTPCSGCYGPLSGVVDMGAKYISALASVVDADSPEEADKIISEVLDPAGTFYRYGLPGSLLRRAK